MAFARRDKTRRGTIPGAGHGHASVDQATLWGRGYSTKAG
jgi:hypothetical protein